MSRYELEHLGLNSDVQRGRRLVGGGAVGAEVFVQPVGPAFQQFFGEADAVVLYGEDKAAAAGGHARAEAHGEVRLPAVHAVDDAVLDEGLQYELGHELAVHLGVGVYRPLEAAAVAALLQLEVIAHEVDAIAHAVELAAAAEVASAQANAEELPELVHDGGRRLVLVLERAPVGRVQHVVEEVRVNLHLQHGELGLLLLQLEHVVELDKPPVFLDHVVEDAAEAADIVAVPEIGLGVIVAAGEAQHTLRELGQRPREHGHEHPRERQHRHEEEADYEQRGANQRGLAPERAAVLLDYAAYEGRAGAGLVINLPLLPGELGLEHLRLVPRGLAELRAEPVRDLKAAPVEDDLPVAGEQQDVRRRGGVVRAEQHAHVQRDGDDAYGPLGVEVVHLLPQRQLGRVVELHEGVGVLRDILPLLAAAGGHKPLEGPLLLRAGLRERAAGVVDGDVGDGLALQIVEHHAEQVELEARAHEQVLRPGLGDGQAGVGVVHKLLRLGGGRVVLREAVYIPLVLLYEYAHVAEGLDAARVLLGADEVHGAL